MFLNIITSDINITSKYKKCMCKTSTFNKYEIPSMQNDVKQKIK